MKKNKTEQFCKKILCSELPRKRALTNILMGLSSSPDAKSVVSVTESRHCHYTYSNVGKVVEDLSKNAAQLAAVTQ